MNYVFGREFEELVQGSNGSPAYHGQATHSKWPISNPRLIRPSRQSHFWQPHWFLPNIEPFEERLGGRIALVAHINVAGSKVGTSNLHLESRGNAALRILGFKMQWPAPAAPLPLPYTACLKGAAGFDWAFVRGPMRASSGHVQGRVKASAFFMLTKQTLFEADTFRAKAFGNPVALRCESEAWGRSPIQRAPSPKRPCGHALKSLCMRR